MSLIDNPLFCRIMADVGVGLIIGYSVGFVADPDTEHHKYWAIGGALFTLGIDYGTSSMMQKNVCLPLSDDIPFRFKTNTGDVVIQSKPPFVIR